MEACFRISPCEKDVGLVNVHKLKMGHLYETWLVEQQMQSWK